MANGLTWPNGKKVAVSVTVMFETWADDKAPTYSVHHASQTGDARSCRQGLVHLRRPGGRLAHHQASGSTRHSRHVLRQRALHRGISRSGQTDRALRPRHRRPRLYPGPAPRLHVIGATGEHDPPQHRSLAAMRRQDGDRLGLSGGRLHAGNRRLPCQGGAHLDDRRHLCRSADQNSDGARRDRRRANDGFLRQPRAARQSARSLPRPQGHLRVSHRERTHGAFWCS